jgi:AcrR family transcriptional regulator
MSDNTGRSDDGEAATVSATARLATSVAAAFGAEVERALVLRPAQPAPLLIQLDDSPVTLRPDAASRSAGPATIRPDAHSGRAEGLTLRPEGPRPRRGAPEATRARLIKTAAELFNNVPYWETDSNQIAKAAGYSTGTFYRHFKDKREIFLAAYREWVAEEWANIESKVEPGQAPEDSIDRAADALIEHHRRWRVFRGNLRALVTYDDELRELTHTLRREQLDKMAMLRMRTGSPDRSLVIEAIHMMMFERVCDAIADGDFASLGCSVELAQQEFRALMRRLYLPA